MADNTRNFEGKIIDAAGVPQLENSPSLPPLIFTNDVTVIFHGRDPGCCLLSGDWNTIRKIKPQHILDLCAFVGPIGTKWPTCTAGFARLLSRSL
jgi:hypothetical protein